MTEREIFLAVLDLPDPQARAAFLDQVCAGDAARRTRIEALLRSHQVAGSFLANPAIASLQHNPPADATQQLSSATTPHAPAKARISWAPIPEAEMFPFLGPASRPDSLGRLGHYEILEVMGQGGFGIVFRAFDDVLQRVVAIKALAPEMAVTSPARKRFLREARSSARVRHENVVQVHNVEEQPLPYLVMEYIPGETLQQRLDRTGPLDIQEVVRIGKQIAEGLAAAHRTGLIHRDIKPGNILIEQEPQQHVKITDFGLARAADDASLTQSGIVAGTPLFMSPEQANGEAIDQRTDLFSLGSVLYTMCSGRPPFRAANTLAVLKRVVEDTPRPIPEIIPEVPDGLCKIIARLHAKKPEERFATAQDVADHLGRCLAEWQQRDHVQPMDSGTPTPAPLPSPISSTRVDRPPKTGGVPVPPPVRPARAGQRRWILAAAVLLLGFAGLGISEATSVTDLGGTVIRLFSPEGTLVVEVDDPGVSVTIEGEEVVISGAGAKEIRLKPGQYRVKASKDGKVVRQELVTVTKNGRRVVRISQEPRPQRQVLSATEWEQAVPALSAEGQVKAVVARLKELNPQFDGRVTPTIEEGVVTGLRLSADHIKDLSPVRAFPGLTSLECSGSAPTEGALADLSPLQGLPLKTLGCSVTNVSDLSPLKGMPLTRLYCDNTSVRDLSPLEGMPLTVLNVSYTQVASVLPLKGMPLRVLWINHSRLSDLSPLKGMALEWITIHHTKVSDLSPLEGMPLTQIYLDVKAERDRDILRSLTTLTKINDKPTGEFWKELDQE
jgi:serine/threonine protein kinase